MSVQIKMPALSSTADEGKVAKWLVKEGQRVRSGDIIAEVETDEAIIEIEAVEEGTIVKLLVPEGATAVKVNAPIALLDHGTGGVGRPAAAPPAPAAATRLAPEPAVSRLATPGAPAPAAPTAMVRTRFKTSLAPVTAPGLKAQPQAPTALAGASAAPAAPAKTTFMRAQDVQTDPVTGWLVVVKGPGRGGFRPLFPGMNAIGRDPGQRVPLSFGDDTISRQEHAFITYDDEQRRFFIQHGGKANLVRVGDKPVLIPTELKANDRIRMGKTTLRFVPCCGPDFSWAEEA
ncbi:MAG: biotin/lipoyl-containing protein [Hyphomicrobiaceae bacterium]|nr:biotin/lipoyl-containing protein [Hyphomicrobiaceae bacterium]